MNPTPVEIALDKKEALALLQAMVRNPEAIFRPGQWEAISAVVHKRQKTIVIQRTGWGKSFVYFAATKLNRLKNRGLTILISPLLALMRDQCVQAEKCGIRCSTINSTNSADWDRIKAAVLRNSIDVLIVSPERLANSSFMMDVLYPIVENIGLLVVDEVHCISDWGHDFRPDYRRIARILTYLPEGTPLLGTTATANNRVIADITGILGKDVVFQRGDLTRESLYLDTVELPDKPSRLAWLVKNLPLIRGSGLIYVLTQKDAMDVAKWLKQNGINAEAYHASVENRVELERKLINNELKALVATSALGMGFDKPDISFVIHYQTPGNLVAYYQQVGRAGRAIPKAAGILMAGKEDAQIQKFFRENAFPTEEEVEIILSALEKTEGLTTFEIQREVNMKPSRISTTLKYLSTETPAPLTSVGNKWKRTPVKYQYDHEKVRRITAIRVKEWKEAQEYVKTDQCKMMFLANALDNEFSKPCGQCSSCRGRHIFMKPIREELRRQAEEFIGKRYFKFEPKKRLPAVPLAAYQFSRNTTLPSTLWHETGWALSEWENDKIGERVAKQKLEGMFQDDLVDDFAKMIYAKELDQRVKWVTCIPSLRQPDLVMNFASRVAKKLGLPFLDVLQKVKDNEPQSQQENSAHRIKNLDGAFKLKSRIPNASVLLIDDIYDSGWTFCVVAALLRQNFNKMYASSISTSAVFPVALAKISL